MRKISIVHANRFTTFASFEILEQIRKDSDYFDIINLWTNHRQIIISDS